MKRSKDGKGREQMTLVRMQQLRRGLCGCLHVVALSVSGCGARTEDTFDSQSHWLECAEQEECGTLSCECELCTIECTSDEECWNTLGPGARCQSVSSFGCTTTPNASRICVPDCPDERCLSEEPSSASDTDQTELGAAPPELVSVPECPSLSPVLSLPANFRTNLTQYAGPATVDESDGERIRLIPDTVAGEVVEISSHPAGMSELFAPGQRFEIEVEAPLTPIEYKAIVVRSDSGEPLVAIYQGYDVWYQDGRLSASTLGGDLELRMACQSNVGDVCFEAQVQSSYTGIFSADTSVALEGDGYEVVTIGGKPFEVYAWATGVFGGDRKPDCSDVSQGRTLAFVLYKKE
jgi:hypothetical protein